MYCRFCGKVGLDGERCVYCGTANVNGGSVKPFNTVEAKAKAAFVPPQPVAATAHEKHKNGFSVAGFWFAMGTFIFICFLSVSQVFLARPEGAFALLPVYNLLIFLSEFTAITGLVLSSMGVNKAKRFGGSGKKLAVAGIVIACFVILSVTGQIIAMFVNS